MLDDDSSSSPCIKGDVSVRVRVLFGSFSVIFFWHSCDVGWLNVEVDVEVDVEVGVEVNETLLVEELRMKYVHFAVDPKSQLGVRPELLQTNARVVEMDERIQNLFVASQKKDNQLDGCMRREMTNDLPKTLVAFCQNNHSLVSDPRWIH